MNASRALTALRHRLLAAADPDYALQIQRLVPGIRTHGVRVPVIRALAGELGKPPDGAPAPSFAALCALLDDACADGWRDEILAAMFAVGRSKKSVATLSWQQVERWLAAVDNWETCDQLATNVAAELLARTPTLGDRLLDLAQDANPWRRRFSLATAVGLNQRGRANPGLALAVAARLVHDREATVQKALAWALREVSEHDAAAAGAFLMRHKDALSRTVLREGSEKLDASVRADLLA